LSTPADIIIIYYNYDKLGYYASICLKPRKKDLKEIEEEKINIQVKKDKSGNKKP
jgi:hypothetical protein